jgi:hypothetical protein
MKQHTGLWCILAGIFLEGPEYIIGPFTSHEEAEAYSDAEYEREKGVYLPHATEPTATC